MKKVTLLVAFIATIGFVHAQSTYKQAIGARVSPTHQEYELFSGSYKFFVTDPGAIELNLGFGGKRYPVPGESRDKNAPGISFSGTYQHHFDIKPVDGLRWFIGGGGVLYNIASDYDRYKGFGAGVYPTGGIDYKFNKIPLNLTADVRPTFYVARPENFKSFHGQAVGIAARYAF